jgi:ABC-type transport system involved in multi-copper enzyme maturation permease subunit
MRATWLTWRINRFEILFVLALAAFVGVSAWVLADQIRSLGMTEALCWPRNEDYGYATPACDAMMEQFWPLVSQASLIRVVLTIAPGLLGIILGVPVVAREVELRTASFSWALTPSRWRWLIARFLPMLLVGVVALAVVAWAGTTLFDALWLGRYGPDLTEVAAQGVALVVRGLAAVAVALLIGALVGRTMPALLIAVVVFAGWGLLVVPRAQAVLAEQRSTWVHSSNDDSWIDGDSPLAYAEFGTFDVSRPGVNGEPGARITYEEWDAQLNARILEACGEYPGDDAQESRAGIAYQDCLDRIQRDDDPQWDKTVPRSAWGDFVALDVLMSTLLGVGALLATVVVVAVRKPE